MTDSKVLQDSIMTFKPRCHGLNGDNGAVLAPKQFYNVSIYTFDSVIYFADLYDRTWNKDVYSEGVEIE